MSSDEILGARLADIQTAAFTRLVERLLWHLGFVDVSNVDGPGDGGADLVARRGGERWVIQAKSKVRRGVDADAVDELLQGVQRFGARRGAVVTNGSFTAKARARAAELKQSTGLDFLLWDRDGLKTLVSLPDFKNRFSTPDLRSYQTEAFQAARADLDRNGRAFLVLATGLGKTVIAGSLIDWHLGRNPGAQVLVLAHTLDLVDQLERAMWRHLPGEVPTQQVRGEEKPDRLDGVTVATIQSAIDYIRSGFRPDLVFIDEAHHVGGATQYASLLHQCKEALLLGATATPWRGDRFDVADVFGDPSYAIGIEEGMRLGYLSAVDYRLFVDNIDWGYVQQLSENDYSISDLNARLFIPQRDEEIRDVLIGAWAEVARPRGIVFCRTIDHANSLLATLRGVPYWHNAQAIHTGIPKAERNAILAQFRLGDVPLVLAVDVLNEGVDVPDVNIVCFARVTHSRRIFVQQLGRGLRISEGKDRVVVLDFVTDLRRAKALLDLRGQVVGDRETLFLPSEHRISFSSERGESFLSQWLRDAADLDTPADQVHLSFPPEV